MRYLEAGITVLLIGVAIFFVGCTRSEAPVGNDERVESDSDGHSHASDHHHHSKQSPDPLYGGQVVAIGHTHRGSDHTHYYVEVMPVVDDRLTFHVLSVNAKNEAEAFKVEAAKIDAYVDRLAENSDSAQEIVFSANHGDNGGSEFVATIPEPLRAHSKFLVVVPKVTVRGERFHFSFTTSKPDAPTEPKVTSESE
ncbi:MAG: hypothetical protein MI757_13555 [Pirellulales bacterium]|nr:hypothetical protein [Pirellulales bacterium]